jgi:hypothetical protein
MDPKERAQLRATWQRLREMSPDERQQLLDQLAPEE